jgi:hypothetical protein
MHKKIIEGVNDMFLVEDKNTGKTHEVYDIAYDKKGYPHFLIYKDGQWLRLSAKHFKPSETFIGVFEVDEDAVETFSEHRVLVSDYDSNGMS